MEFLTLHYKFISSKLLARLSDYSHSSVKMAINIQYEQPILSDCFYSQSSGSTLNNEIILIGRNCNFLGQIFNVQYHNQVACIIGTIEKSYWLKFVEQLFTKYFDLDYDYDYAF